MILAIGLSIAACAQDLATARSLLEGGDAEGAARACEDALEKEPGDADLLVVLASARARLGRLDEGLEACRAAIEAKSAHLPARLLGGELALFGHRYREALEHFRAASAIAPGDGRGALGEGLALYGLVEYAEAAVAFRRALAANPSLVAARLHLGKIAYEGADFGEAEREFADGARLDGRNAEARFFLGLCRRRAEDLRGASAAFEEALRLDPTHLGAHLNLAQVLPALGREDEARSHLETHGRLVRIYDRFAFLRDSLRLDPGSAGNRVLLARAYLEAGLPEAAALELREALRRKPDFLPALLGLAEVATAAGELPEAEKRLREVLARDPQNARARSALAGVLERLGRAEEARRLRAPSSAADGETPRR